MPSTSASPLHPTCLTRQDVLTYVTGDATQPHGHGPKILVHVCNDLGAWGRGFVLALSRRYPEPEAAYRHWISTRAMPFHLGAVQFVRVRPDLQVANLIGQRGVRRIGGRPPVRYSAIRAGLERVRTEAQAQGASVHMPRLGAGLAGGDWRVIEQIIREELCAAGVAVTVYDLPSRTAQAQRTLSTSASE